MATVANVGTIGLAIVGTSGWKPLTRAAIALVHSGEFAGDRWNPAVCGLPDEPPKLRLSPGREARRTS